MKYPRREYIRGIADVPRKANTFEFTSPNLFREFIVLRSRSERSSCSAAPPDVVSVVVMNIPILLLYLLLENYLTQKSFTQQLCCAKLQMTQFEDTTQQILTTQQIGLNR